MVGIYKIENIKNGKIYIGKSINIKYRRNQHMSALRRGVHCNSHLQRSFTKYGEENFKFEIVHECTEDDINYFESYFIKEFKTFEPNMGYNRSFGGEGEKRTDAFKENMSIIKRFENTNLTYDDVSKIKMCLYCCMDRDEICSMFNINKGVLVAIANGSNFSYVLEYLNKDIYKLKQKLIDERNELILEYFDNGYKIVEICKILELSSSIVEKCVYKYRQPQNEKNKKYQEIYDKVFKMHNEGIIDYHIAKELNISASTVSRYLKGENNPYNKLPFKKLTKDEEICVIDDYANGLGIWDLCSKYNLSTTTIYSTINSYKNANTEVI